ncbi:MAG: hypothetical protein ACE15E_05585 [Acidobacteriota bacterium]
MRDLVLEYYFVLRSALRAQPGLRRCLTRCRHYRIFFLTDPRNAGRRDLGCPFGCREAHRKRSSTRRSVACYQTKEGRLKKEFKTAGGARTSPRRRSRGLKGRSLSPAW